MLGSTNRNFKDFRNILFKMIYSSLIKYNLEFGLLGLIVILLI